MPATYNRVHPGEGADRPISFCRPLDRIAQQLDSAAIHAQLGPWQCLGKCHSTRPELGRTRLNLTVPVRISNRFSPHLGGEEGIEGRRRDGPRSIVPLRLFPIQFPRERTSPSISPNREIQPPPFAARANLVAREWINFFFSSFAARKTSGDNIEWTRCPSAKRKRSIGLDINIQGKTEL